MPQGRTLVDGYELSCLLAPWRLLRTASGVNQPERRAPVSGDIGIAQAILTVTCSTVTQSRHIRLSSVCTFAGGQVYVFTSISLET